MRAAVRVKPPLIRVPFFELFFDSPDNFNVRLVPSRSYEEASRRVGEKTLDDYIGREPLQKPHDEIEVFLVAEKPERVFFIHPCQGRAFDYVQVVNFEAVYRER